MSKSARLRASDVRALYELAGECRDLGDDPHVWRQRFFAGVARLIGADLVAGGELAGVRTGAQRNLGSAAWGWEHGFNPAGWRRALELLDANPRYSLQMVRYAERVRVQEGVALSGMDLVGEREFLRGVEYQEVHRTIGVHHVMWCSRFIPGTLDETDGALFWRAAGRRDFVGREKALLGEAYATVTPLISGPLARFAERSPGELSSRQRQVLRCLLEGDGDKQAAARLGISRFTVNVHTKAIFRHFGVQGRAELLARWVRRGWGARCAWAEDVR
jgi:DNA-binding CsgD family transcriptional regulator